MEIIILNKNFRKVAAIDYYTEFTWTRGFHGDGECQFTSPITGDLLSYATKGNYIFRPDDPMICEIVYVELNEANEQADSIVVKGKDITLSILNKRLIWSNFIYSGSINGLIKKLIAENFGSEAIESRRVLATDGTDLIKLVNVGGVASELITFKSQNESIGDCIDQILQIYDYGFLLTVEEDDQYLVHLVLRIYKPTARTNYIVFSYENENLVSTNYTAEYSDSPNVALVAGETRDNARRYQSVGSLSTGLDRTEVFVDANDLSSTLDWKNVFNDYPPKKKIYNFPNDPTNGGYMEPFDTKIDGNPVTLYYYIMGAFSIGVEDADHLQILKNIFKGHEWWLTNDPASGMTCFNVKDAPIAIFSYDAIANPPPKDEDGNYTDEPEVMAMDVLYLSMMMATGYETLCSYGGTFGFSGEINPNVMYKYKKDYIVGDYVTISNKYGISAVAQITTATETYDSSGYHVDVTVETTSSKEDVEVISVLCTDNLVPIATDDGRIISL